MTEILLAKIRKSGLTVTDIARQTGVAQSILTRFVNGKRSLTLPTAERLALYFNLELRERKER
jgi:plasmid maintenance system antidote protein VapI